LIFIEREEKFVTLQEVIAGIRPANRQTMARARAHWDAIAHPLNGLGLLEDDIVRIAGMTGAVHMDITKRAVVAMCADNGVVAEGVTQTGQEVTALVTERMANGTSSVCCMARLAGADMFPVDIGVAVPVAGDRLVQRCVRRGTGNFTQGPAMTRKECEQAIMTGVGIVRTLVGQHYRLIATGEMGIGNTTTSAAVVCALMGMDPAEVAGRGAGLSDKGLIRKINTIRRGIAVNQPDPTDPVDVLHKVGGLDLAGLTGVFLGGAMCRIPVVIDGFIASAAARAAASPRSRKN